MACTGIEFCKLAIVETKGRARDLYTELGRRLPDFDTPMRRAASEKPFASTTRAKVTMSFRSCIAGSLAFRRWSPLRLSRPRARTGIVRRPCARSGLCARERTGSSMHGRLGFPVGADGTAQSAVDVH